MKTPTKSSASWRGMLVAALFVWPVASALGQDQSDAPASEEAAAEEAEPTVGDEDIMFTDGIFTPSEKIEADSEVSLPSDI